MTTGPKLTLYGVLLAAVFAAGLGLGTVAGPIDVGGGHDAPADSHQPATTELPANEREPADDHGDH